MTMQRKTALSKGLSVTNVQFLALLAAGIFQFLILVSGGNDYRYIDNYAIIPPILFLGTVLTQKPARSAKRQLQLCLLIVLWFIIVQTQHALSGLNTPPVGFFFCAYLLALPFAALAQDGSLQRGLKAIAAVYLAGSLTLVACAVLLILDRLPGFLQNPITLNGIQVLNLRVYWDGARLWALWHPNTCANILMVGVALSMGFFFRAKSRWSKCLLLAASALQFMALALTHSRTTLILTSVLIGGIVFFCIYKGGRKRFAVGILAAIPIVLGLFLAGSTLYDLHYERLAAKLAAETAAVQTEDAKAVSEIVEETLSKTANASAELVETALIKTAKADELQSSAPQGTLSQDLKTLNGRTEIWINVLYAIKKDPSLLIFGTDNPGSIISKYNSFTVWHSHNSWAEVLLSLGLPGLLAALVITWIAVRHAFVVLFKQSDMWKKCIALLVLCFLAVSIMEPYLFYAHRFSPFFEFLIFLCIGYLTQWSKPEACKAAG